MTSSCFLMSRNRLTTLDLLCRYIDKYVPGVSCSQVNDPHDKGQFQLCVLCTMIVQQNVKWSSIAHISCLNTSVYGIHLHWKTVIVLVSSYFNSKQCSFEISCSDRCASIFLVRNCVKLSSKVVLPLAEKNATASDHCSMRATMMPSFWDTPAAPWLPILVIHIRSQVKTRQSKVTKNAKNSKSEILQEILIVIHLLKLLDKMLK